MSQSSRSPIVWGNYVTHPEAESVRLDPSGARFSWELLSRADAFRRYQILIDSRQARVTMVLDLALANGYAASLDEEGLAELNRFLLENLPVNRAPSAVTGTELVTPRWISVMWDIGLALGESAIIRYPHLYWEFFDPKRKNVMGMHSPAIMGHRRGDPTLPFSHVEGYVSEICHPRAPRIAHVKGIEVHLPPTPVRPDLFRTLSKAEDYLA